MNERIPSGTYFQYSPLGVPSSPYNTMRPSTASMDRESNRYLTELLAERHKLGPFIQILPLCNRLINQEIVLASGLASSKAFVDERIDHESPLRSASFLSNGAAMDLKGWSGMQTEENGSVQRMNISQASPLSWHGAPGIPTIPVVTKIVRLDVPVDKFPNYNFVGRLLGPRGNSLKRVEATTECRVYIRGRGSVKDSAKEEKLRDKPGYEHLSEPLHVIVEAKLPANVVDSRLGQVVTILEELLKPVEETLDYYKKQQLRELALLNGTLREESPSPHMSPSVSPFNCSGMKRAKTGC